MMIRWIVRPLSWRTRPERSLAGGDEALVSAEEEVAIDDNSEIESETCVRRVHVSASSDGEVCFARISLYLSLGLSATNRHEHGT